MRFGRKLIAVAALVPLLGCAMLEGATAPRASQEEERAYAAAVSAQAADAAGGEQALESFLQLHPESPLADDASLRLGRAALARGDSDAALRHFEWVIRHHPGGDRADPARLELARLRLARGERAAAARSANKIRLSRLSEPERREAYRLLADLSERPSDELRWLAQVRAVEADEDRVALVDVEIDELLVGMESQELYRAADQIGPEIPAARALLRAADLALDADDAARARKALDRADRLPIAPAYEGRVEAVRTRLRVRTEGPLEEVSLPRYSDLGGSGPPSTREASGTLGVVLPLSGRFARFGEESLRGVLLATGVFGAPPDGPRVRVLVRDSVGRPEDAARAVRELAGLGVTAIIGPLLSGECEAAAAAAEAEGVPLLALTARPEVSAARPHVFRVRTMPAEEVEALVEHSMGSLGAERFAILYPRDGYGRGLRRLFWQAVERRGGRVVGIASYDADATDFADPIRSLVGYSMLTPGEKEALKERDKLEKKARRLPAVEAAALREEARAMTGPGDALLPPIVDFDALFIPESHEKVVLIAPQLAFHEAVGSHLLGVNGWYHKDLVPIAREHVEGARFTAHFYPDSPLPFVRDFRDRYALTYSVPADVFAAQAYDAANLVLVQLARGYDTRQAVRDGVLATRGYPGVTGVLSMRADGNARKRPFLLGVERGKIGQVE